MEHNTNCDPEQDSDSAIIEAFCSGAAAAPLPPPPPPGSTSSGPCQQGAGCTVVCAAKLMPLLSGPCAPLLRRLYDGVDGTYDGRAAVFDPITHQCQAMPTTTVIKGLAQLQESGECASHGISLNGLAEQSVGPVPPPPPPCTETMGSAMCSRAISSGVFSCAIDYCEACSGKGQCDTTCAFCTAAPPSPPAPPDTNCDIDSFQARSRRVTADCCDEPGHACVDGIASACDAKCATSYVEFFEQCQSAIGAFLPGRLHAFEALYATCTSLSAQVLLDTAVRCVPMGACNATGVYYVASNQTITGGTDSDSCTTPYFSYGGLFGIPGASTCNVATLPARVAAMASACCLSSDPNGAAPRQQCADFAAMNTDCG